MDKLIESEDEEQTESPPEAEPKEAERKNNGTNSNWPLGIVVALVAAGLIVGLIFLARWIYHVAHNTKATKNPTTSQTQNKGGLSVSSGGSNGGGISVSGGKNQTGNKSNTSKGTTLPNNGPGNVIGVFAAASFAAGALHYIISLRKSVQEE